jgi:hypothetical protein
LPCKARDIGWSLHGSCRCRPPDEARSGPGSLTAPPTRPLPRPAMAIFAQDRPCLCLDPPYSPASCFCPLTEVGAAAYDWAMPRRYPHRDLGEAEMQGLPGRTGVYGTILAHPPWQFHNRTGKVAPELGILVSLPGDFTLGLAALVARSRAFRSPSYSAKRQSRFPPLTAPESRNRRCNLAELSRDSRGGGQARCTAAGVLQGRTVL